MKHTCSVFFFLKTASVLEAYLALGTNMKVNNKNVLLDVRWIEVLGGMLLMTS